MTQELTWKSKHEVVSGKNDQRMCMEYRIRLERIGGESREDKP